MAWRSVYTDQKVKANALFIAHKRSLGQGNIFTPVSHSGHRGEICLSPPQGPGTSPNQAPPRTRHLPGPGIPPAQSMLGDTVNEWAVRILLECNLVIRRINENSNLRCEQTKICSYSSDVKSKQKPTSI